MSCISQIYSAGVSVFLGGNKHSRTGDVRGDISINFSCDPEISFKLVSDSCLFHHLLFLYLSVSIAYQLNFLVCAMSLYR